jgi:hypothetical protein
VQREDRGIETVGLCELPRAAGEVADLAGIGHHDGQAYRRAGRDGGPLEPAGGFADNERGRGRPQPSDELCHTGIVVRHLPALAAGPDCDVQGGFGNIKADGYTNSLLIEAPGRCQIIATRPC